MPRQRRGRVTLPTLRTPSALPRGPKLYREPKDRGYAGPTVPPEGFLGATNSRYEWMIYHAISRATGFPVEPRTPPFIGFPGVWVYQKAFDQGRDGPGGSIIDFVVYGGAGNSGEDIALRIQTEFFHIFTDSAKHAYDEMQKARLSGFFRVVDLYDQDFAWDDTNQAAVVLVKRALAGETFPNPLSGGTAQRVRPGNLR